jgi:micrococcal nuclease
MTSRPLVTVLVGLALLVTGCAGPSVSTRSTTGYPVTKIVDGDTVHVNRNGQDVKVRLLRINTTERGKFGYKQGQRQLAKLIGDRPVSLEFEDERRDRYGRELAYLISEGKNLNIEMVRSGWTRFYVKYGTGKYAKAFRRAENEAKSARRGLWSQ